MKFLKLERKPGFNPRHLFAKTNVFLLLLALLIVTPVIVFVVKVSGQTDGQLLISEFRLRGPNGANDEFVEIYNNLDGAVGVLASDGSSGYSIAVR